MGSIICFLAEELERLRVGGTGGLLLLEFESFENVLELGVGIIETPDVVLEVDRPRTGAPGRLGGGGGGLAIVSEGRIGRSRNVELWVVNEGKSNPNA